MRWNLDELYTGFDSAEFKADVQKLDELIADLDAYAKANLQGDPGEALKGAVSRIERFYVLFQKAIGYASLRQAVEAENPDANAWLERLSSKQTGAVEALVRFRKYLGELGGKLEEVIAADPALAEFTFFLKENREFAKYMLSDEVEKAISLMEITGSKAWSNLHNTLTSTVMAEMAEGGEVRQLTLPMVRNLAYDPDPDVRRRAYEAELAAYPKIDKSAAACLNGIKGEVLTKCRLRGHKSPLDAVLFESRMDRQTLDAMIGTMHPVVAELQTHEEQGPLPPSVHREGGDAPLPHRIEQGSDDAGLQQSVEQHATQRIAERCPIGLPVVSKAAALPQPALDRGDHYQ